MSSLRDIEWVFATLQGTRDRNDTTHIHLMGLRRGADVGWISSITYRHPLDRGSKHLRGLDRNR